MFLDLFFLLFFVIFLVVFDLFLVLYFYMIGFFFVWGCVRRLELFLVCLVMFLIKIICGWLFLFILKCFMLLVCFFGGLEISLLFVKLFEFLWFLWDLKDFFNNILLFCNICLVFLGVIIWFVLKLNIFKGIIILFELVDLFLYDWVLIIIWRILLWFFLFVCLIIYDMVVM